MPPGDIEVYDAEPSAIDGAPPGARSKFTRMYRVSELTYAVDFLANHDSADLEGQIAFLSSGAPDGRPEFSRLPVTEYCVEHLDRPFAEYISCWPDRDSDPRPFRDSRLNIGY